MFGQCTVSLALTFVLYIPMCDWYRFSKIYCRINFGMTILWPLLFHLWLIILLGMTNNKKFLQLNHFFVLTIHLWWVSSVVVKHCLFVSFLVSSLFSHLMLCYWISYVFMHLFLLRWSLLHLLLSEHLRVYLRIPYFFLVYTVDLCCTFAFEVALVEVYEIYWEWFLHNAFQLFMALGVDCNLSPIHKLMKSYTSK